MWLKTLLWKQKWFWSENWVMWAQPYWFEHFPLSWRHLKAPLNWVCTRFAQNCRVIHWASVTTWTLSWRIWMVLNVPKESTFQNPHAILNWMDCFCYQGNINLLMIFQFLYVLLASPFYQNYWYRIFDWESKVWHPNNKNMPFALISTQRVAVHTFYYEA